MDSFGSRGTLEVSWGGVAAGVRGRQNVVL